MTKHVDAFGVSPRRKPQSAYRRGKVTARRCEPDARRRAGYEVCRIAVITAGVIHRYHLAGVSRALHSYHLEACAFGHTVVGCAEPDHAAQSVDGDRGRGCSSTQPRI